MSCEPDVALPNGAGFVSNITPAGPPSKEEALVEQKNPLARAGKAMGSVPPPAPVPMMITS